MERPEREQRAWEETLWNAYSGYMSHPLNVDREKEKEKRSKKKKRKKENQKGQKKTKTKTNTVNTAQEPERDERIILSVIRSRVEER